MAKRTRVDEIIAVATSSNSEGQNNDGLTTQNGNKKQKRMNFLLIIRMNLC